eukprot:scaffold3632_cov162-Amphora_coffeaeformis.AAC.13
MSAQEDVRRCVCHRTKTTRHNLLRTSTDGIFHVSQPRMHRFQRQAFFRRSQYGGSGCRVV